MRDFSDDIASLRSRLADASAYLRVDELRRIRPQLETEASRPDLWDDADQARKVTGELSSVVEDLELHDGLAARIDDAETLYELGREEGDDSVEAEVAEQLDALRRDFDGLELRACSPASGTTTTRCARSTPARAAPTRRTGPR